MSVTTSLTVDVQQPNIPVITYASQGDQLSRVFQITLVSGSSAWTPPTGAVATVRYSKPDGTSGFYDTVEDGTAAVTVSGNVATVKLIQQMTTVAGTVYVQLNWYTAGTNPQRISSFCWRVFVEAAAVTDGTITSSDYYSILTAQIQTCINAAKKCEAVSNMEVSAETLPAGSEATAEVSGGTSAEDPIVIEFGIPKGDTGSPGSSPTVQSTTTEYQQSTSGTVVPTGTWSATPPAAIAGQFMWTRVTISFGTSGTSVTYTVAYNGTDGSGAVASVNGQTGVVVLDAEDLQYDSTLASHTSGSIGAELATQSAEIEQKIDNPSTKSNGQVLTYNSTSGEWEAQTPSGGGTWGSITGTLSNQTDLQTALDAKAPSTICPSAYSTSTSYAVGDICMYNGNMYVCNTATSGTWASACWTQVVLGSMASLSYTVVSTW